MKYNLLFLFLLLSTSLISQEGNMDKLPDPVKIQGKEYYLHPIEKGNTLYSISKRYGVTIEDLKSSNKELVKEMRIGDTLKIPLSGIATLKEDQEQSDGNFIIHEVQKKNTLYSIAKEYNLEINEIIAANPNVEEVGLKKGMKLRIPVAKIKSEPTLNEYVEPAAASPYMTHRVMPKETLYSLSKAYSVSIDSILIVNNGLEEGLKVNQLINIPVLREYTDSVDQDVKFDSSAIKPTYTVSLLLPFYIEEMKQAEDTTPKTSLKMYQKLYSKAQYAIDFYQGFQMAADSIAAQGLNIELRVFDTANDTAKIRKIIRDSSLVGSDLIVGPLFYDEFVIVADYAKRKQINIVSPVKQSNRILLGNSYVSKVSSSDPVLLKFLGNYVADSLSSSNLLLLYPDHVKEASQAEIFKKSYFSNLEGNTDTNVVQKIPKEVKWDQKEYNAFKQKLDSTQRNVIIVPSSDQAFVTQLMTMLYMENDYKITLIGMEEWKSFDNIEVDYLHKLDVHLVVSEYINLKEKSYQQFEKQYMNEFQVPPQRFSILGFDVGMYYLTLINEYGLNFKVMFLGYQDEFLSRKFEFFKTGIESGYENHSVYLIRYKDFQIQRVY